MSAVETRLIQQVELLLRESGTTESFASSTVAAAGDQDAVGEGATIDAAAWLERWLHRPNHALGGAAPELYLHTPQGEALLSNLIGAMAAGSYM